MSDAFSIFILVVAVLGVGVILWAIRSGTGDREAEDNARTFFAEHGRWPDESLQDADERRRVAAAAVEAVPAVAEPDADGRV